VVYPAQPIAEWFLQRAAIDGDAITQMKLQKLVYVAHGWHLGLKSEPLINDTVEAWRWGPVIRSLYRTYVNYGSHGITPPESLSQDIDRNTVDFLEKIWEVYGKFSAVDLSARTHADGTPWKKAYQDIKPPRIISNEDIAEHYRKLAETRNTQ
jgi:uncharacterized phage-associated protein